MIHWATVVRLLGFFLGGLAVSMAVPLVFALWNHDEGAGGLTAGVLVSGVLGATFWWGVRGEPADVSRRDGILLVTLVWLTLTAVGALPYVFSGYIPSFTDAFFETMSGFTTTGATILTDIEGLPRSLLLWRALTHWLGGMGIIVLGIAVLPILGVGGMVLYRAEFSGARSEKLKPRVAETALALWRIYAALSLAEYLALRWAGMDRFEAVCHTFATMATGGFSTRAASIEAYHSPAIEYVVIVFMLLAGVNFTRHYQLFMEHRVRPVWHDTEIRAYLAITAAATTLVAVTLYVNHNYALEPAFRLAAFQVVSILTTTGFSSANFESWAPFATFILLALMFIGGCTGSTAGGLKVSRMVLLLKVVAREFRRTVEKRGVFAVRMEGRAVPETAIEGLLNLVYIAFLVNFAACLVITAAGTDLITAISAVAACMFNIGPGLGDVGPTDNYAHFSSLVKWVLSLCMLAGRLEFFTLLVLLSPAFWRK